MPGVYEVKYGCSEENFTCDPDSGVVYNLVGGNGWQHPWVHNARYALLIGGGDTDTDLNTKSISTSS